MPGKSSLLDGADACEECVVGKFIPDIESNATCSNCPEGFYVNKAASSLCLACPAGRFQTDAGSTDCDKCSVGFYSPAAESTSCIACPLGYMQPLQDSVGCSVCGAGQEGVSTTEGCKPVSLHVLYSYSLIDYGPLLIFFMFFWMLLMSCKRSVIPGNIDWHNPMVIHNRLVPTVQLVGLNRTMVPQVVCRAFPVLINRKRVKYFVHIVWSMKSPPKSHNLQSV